MNVAAGGFCSSPARVIAHSLFFRLSAEFSHGCFMAANAFDDSGEGEVGAGAGVPPPTR